MDKLHEPLSVVVPIMDFDEPGLIRGLDFLMRYFEFQFGGNPKEAQARCATWLAAKYCAKEPTP